METLNFGLIGAGMIGAAHARALADTPGAKLRTVADVRLEAAQRLTADIDGAEAVDDFEMLLNDDAIDAVVIATPPFLHHDMTLAAVQAGKHVLCEKPFAHHPDAADAMVAAADEAGVVLADCSARHARLNPTYRTVRALLDQQALGDVYLIRHHGRGRRGRPGLEYHPAARWFLSRKQGAGGACLDWGVYDLSLIWGLLGDEVEVDDVTSFTFNGVDEPDTGGHEFDVEEHGGGAFRLSNGAVVLYERASACHMDGGSETRVYGSRGGLKFDPWSRQADHLMYYHDVINGLPTDTPVPIRGQREHPGDHPPIDHDFVAALREGREPAMPGRLAARILRAIFRLYEAAGVPIEPFEG